MAAAGNYKIGAAHFQSLYWVQVVPNIMGAGHLLSQWVWLVMYVEASNEKALGLCCIMKQWGMPHCSHSLAIYVPMCAHRVFGEMPQ